jgi:hypothetical protein
MSVAPTLALRKAIVAHLRSDTAVTATALGQRIYGARPPAEPQWPFMRYGTADAVPGYVITAPLHVFSKADYDDDVTAMAEAIGQSLDGKVLALSDGRRAHLVWAGVRVMGDASEWHAVVSVTATVPRDCG